MIVVEIVSAVLLVLGTVLLVTAALGVLRFPDFYTRLHAAGKGDTMGQALLLLGLILTTGLTLVSVKLGLIVFFILIFNPTATHALARGAWVCGVRARIGQDEPPFRQREGQSTDAERDALIEPLGDDSDADAGADADAGKEDAWSS